MLNQREMMIKSFNDFNSLDELRNGMNVIKKLCNKHELLYKSFYLWKNSILKNECQLEILNETAKILRARRETLAQALTTRRALNDTDSQDLLKRLDNEIHAVEKQVDEWIKNLAEVSHDRTKLNIDLIQLRCKLRHSLTNINLAHIDFEVVEQQHLAVWRQFLNNIPNSKITKLASSDSSNSTDTATTT